MDFCAVTPPRRGNAPSKFELASELFHVREWRINSARQTVGSKGYSSSKLHGIILDESGRPCYLVSSSARGRVIEFKRMSRVQQSDRILRSTWKFEILCRWRVPRGPGLSIVTKWPRFLVYLCLVFSQMIWSFPAICRDVFRASPDSEIYGAKAYYNSTTILRERAFQYQSCLCVDCRDFEHQLDLRYSLLGTGQKRSVYFDTPPSCSRPWDSDRRRICATRV